MKTSHPQLALFSCLLLAAALGYSSCGWRASVRESLGLNIARSVTHVAAGRSVRLTAYEEYRESSGSLMSVQAAPLAGILRAPVLAAWSVSDASLASISVDGTLTALKPGRITVTGAWEKYTASTVIEVVQGLPLDSLPQMTARPGSSCTPQSMDLSLDEDRTLRFQMALSGCTDLSLEARAPDTPLPWRLEAGNGFSLEITEARGPVVKGVARRAADEVSFTAWSAGTGAYPLRLDGRKVLLVGDSMGQGIAPFLQRKVEAAGGSFVAAPEQSSTIIWWQGSGKLRALAAKHRPDIIFIALGSNELYLKAAEERAAVIRQMVADIGGRDAYWIGPPVWKAGSKLPPVIEENFQAGHFYNSDQLDVARAKDGKHPTLQGFERWVELIWRWYARAL